MLANLKSFLPLAPAVLIGFLPILLHIVDKVLEREFSPLREEVLRGRMADDNRPPVAAVGNNEALFRAVAAYFKYERAIHFVVVLTLFNIISLYFAQIECTGSPIVFTYVTLLAMVALLLFSGLFFWKVANEDFEPAAVKPARGWTLAAITSFVLVVVIEVMLQLYGGDLGCLSRSA